MLATGAPHRDVAHPVLGAGVCGVHTAVGGSKRLPREGLAASWEAPGVFFIFFSPTLCFFFFGAVFQPVASGPAAFAGPRATLQLGRLRHDRRCQPRALRCW